MSVGGEGRGGGSKPRSPEILFCFDKLLDSSAFLGIQPSALGSQHRARHQEEGGGDHSPTEH